MKLYCAVTLIVLTIVPSVYGQEVLPFAEQERATVQQWWREGILTEDNLQQFLDALRKEAPHPDRLERALDRAERGSIQRFLYPLKKKNTQMSETSLNENPLTVPERTEGREVALAAPGLRENPLLAIYVLLALIALAIFIALPKKTWSLWVGIGIWTLGFIVNLPTLPAFIVGCVIVIPIACVLRWAIGKGRQSN